jgi:hypothetical protein
MRLRNKKCQVARPDITLKTQKVTQTTFPQIPQPVFCVTPRLSGFWQ